MAGLTLPRVRLGYGSEYFVSVLGYKIDDTGQITFL